MPDHPIIDDGVRALIKLTAKETAEHVLQQHKNDCPVGALKREVWGNGKQGIRDDVKDLKSDVKVLQRGRSLVWEIVKPAIVALVVSAVFLVADFASRAHAERKSNADTQQKEIRK